MILDTNALSALAARDPALLRLLDCVDQICLSFVTVAEFQFGLLGSTRPQVGFTLLEQLAAIVPVLYPESDTLVHYAAIADKLKRSGRAIPHNDIWTAALARQHGLPVLSRDRHFDFIDSIQRVEW